jgi:manganese transport protein
VLLPIPMIALVLFTHRRVITGVFADTRLADLADTADTAAIMVLNAVPLPETFGAAVPAPAAWWSNMAPGAARAPALREGAIAH